MIELFETYRRQIIYAVTVVISVIVLHFVTNFIHKWLVKKEQEKFPEERATPLNLVKQVLNALWLVLGLIALSFLFVEEEKYAVLTKNFNIVLYLGFLAVITIVAASSTNLWFRKSIRKKIANQNDPTSFKFLRYIAVFGVYFVGILFGLLAFPSLKGVAQTALGGAGVIALIAGVASQEALANLVGGVFIISFKPFKIGDTIKITDSMVGIVTDITLRHTIIRNFENKMIVIPNSIINKEKLVNYDLGELKCCEHVEIGISYDSNIVLAKRIMQEECEAHPLILDNRTEWEKNDDAKPMVKTAVIRMNDSSITVRAWAWSKSFGDSFQLKCDVLESIKNRFDSEGIEIPFPYRTVVIKDTSKKQPS